MANKPVLHAHDHQHGGADPVRITWESTGGAGTGGGIQFDIDNIGGTLRVETTDTLTGLPTGVGIRFITDSGTFYVSSARDVNMDAVQDILFFPGRDFVASANRDASVTADRDVVLKAAGVSGTPGVDGNIILSALPTSDPGVSGALWNNGGTLMVS